MSFSNKSTRALGVPVIVCLLVGCGSGASRYGPLIVDGGKSVVGSQAQLGQRVAYGFNVMTNPGDNDITNITATLLPEDNGGAEDAIFEAPLVVEIGARDLAYLGAGPWPDKEYADYARPLEGYVLPAHSGRVDLLLITKVKGKGRWFWPSTRIEYDYEGRHYAKEISNGFAICAPAPCDTHITEGP